MKTWLPLSALVALVCAAPLLAGDPASDAGFAARQQFDSPVPELRQEVQWLPDQSARPGVRATPAATAFDAPAPAPGAPLPADAAGLAAAPPAAPSSAGQDEFFTLDELKGEMKKLAWTKGDFKVVPYGSLWGSAIYETERTFPGQYTLYVFSADEQGDHSFVIDTRRTRLGLDVAGPQVPVPWFGPVESGGKVEIDFHGTFVLENRPGLLLRHAYGELKNDEFRLLAGQTYDVISPLWPGTLNYAVGWGVGNIGYRRAQVRAERFISVSDRLLFTVQGSANQNIISDLTGTPGVIPESTGWPVIEGRLAATLGERGEGCRPMTVGVSGHVGEQGFDFTTTGPPPLSLPPRDDARVPTWSFNADVYVPLGERLGVEGEFFTGENLSTFLGGVVQGVSPFTRETIRATGGWFDFWFHWTPKLHTYAGFGIDDPFDRDLVSGRRYNHFFFANAVYDLTKQLNVGVEVSSWKTLYTETRPGFPDLRPGESVVFEFTGKYGF